MCAATGVSFLLWALACGAAGKDVTHPLRGQAGLWCARWRLHQGCLVTAAAAAWPVRRVQWRVAPATAAVRERWRVVRGYARRPTRRGPQGAAGGAERVLRRVAMVGMVVVSVVVAP